MDRSFIGPMSGFCGRLVSRLLHLCQQPTDELTLSAVIPRRLVRTMKDISLKVFAEWTWSIPEMPADSWLVSAIALIILMFFIWLIARLTTSANEDIDPAETDRQMLTVVTELKSRGELTPDEYRSIKSRLVTRLSDATDGDDSDESVENDQHHQENECELRSTTETPEGTTVSDDAQPTHERADVEDRISEKD